MTEIYTKGAGMLIFNSTIALEKCPERVSSREEADTVWVVEGDQFFYVTAAHGKPNNKWRKQLKLDTKAAIARRY